MVFADRADAGRRLAAKLGHLRGEPLVILGLPRGGVPVAFEVARALAAPLDVIVVRKLGVPFQPELGMGAIGEDGVRVLNPEIVRAARVSGEDIAVVEARERAELERRVRRLRGGRPRQPLAGRVAVVVDDGIATGSTARAACRVARAQGAARVVLAVPVAPPGWEAQIGADADEKICVDTPGMFFAIGQFYGDFSQTADEEVIACLQRAAPLAAGARAGAADPDDPPASAREIEATVGDVKLAGRLAVPRQAAGIVVLAHASATGRHSPRSRYLSVVFHQAGLATLLADLLTAAEQLDPAIVFDIGLLARRLAAVTQWVRAQPGVAGLPLGYLGTRTAAAAALRAAGEPGARVAAVVCRGGRPDLASARLASVRSPTLMIVAQQDEVLLRRHRQAQAELHCENRLAFVPGGSDLLEVPGALAAAAELSLDWFTSHLEPAADPVS
jgi:putative phosphoribosyl transferase